MPWYKHRDGNQCASGKITFGITSRAGPAVIYKDDEAAYFMAPEDEGVQRRLDRAGHEALEEAPPINPVDWAWKRAPFVEAAHEQLFRQLEVKTIGDIADINRKEYPRLATLADQARAYLAPWLDDPHAPDQALEKPGVEAPTADEVATANRPQLWDWVKEADPDNTLSLSYSGNDSADADDMRDALAEHYDLTLTKEGI